jgi:hypothetical protein
MGEYLSFKKLITPVLIQLLFWIAVFGNTLSALFDSGGFWAGLLQLVIGPILIRVFCEGLIVIFEINNTLTEIRDRQRNVVVPAPSPMPPTSFTETPTPPAV